MPKHLVIDGDSLIYMAAASQKMFTCRLKDGGYYSHPDENIAASVAAKTKKELEELPFYPPVAHACHKLDNSIAGILEAVGHDNYDIVIGGDMERLYKSLLYPQYKRNRTGEKPLHYVKVRNHLIAKYQTIVVDHKEADEYVIKQKYNLYFEITDRGYINHDVVIAAQDKDILYLTPGTHYNYRHGTWVDISVHDAARNFALYVLSGDASDNIPGIHGLGEPKFETNGRLIEKGRTVDALGKIEINIEGLDDLEIYADVLHEYLVKAYEVYKQKLPGLSPKELKNRFITTCKLLWFPHFREDSIEFFIGFDEVCK